MAGHKVEVAREILAAPEQVWAVLTDIDAAPKVLSSVVSVERVGGPDYDVGTRWRETRRMFGKVEIEEMWVTEAIEPRSTTIVADSGGTRYTTVFTCVPSELGVELSVEFSASTPHPKLGQRVGWAVFGKIGMKATENALKQDLEDIATAAESARR
ncbi:SRPBCC family protein [Demequina aurantiaca]|uniref:SRPBCC family protein n=1 Tax=Demequina aurantiaca TaxID=676200 RepID=UPI000781BE49|nr:SRPBCC family protein [Demequina aurantiaca]